MDMLLKLYPREAIDLRQGVVILLGVIGFFLGAFVVYKAWTAFRVARVVRRIHLSGELKIDPVEEHEMPQVAQAFFRHTISLLQPYGFEIVSADSSRWTRWTVRKCTC